MTPKFVSVDKQYSQNSEDRDADTCNHSLVR